MWLPVIACNNVLCSPMLISGVGINSGPEDLRGPVSNQQFVMHMPCIIMCYLKGVKLFCLPYNSRDESSERKMATSGIHSGA